MFAGLADKLEQNKVYDFFFHLNRHIGKPGFFGRFRENWSKIEECKFSPQQVGAILHRVANHTKGMEIQGKISDYIHQNIDPIEKAAISYLEGDDFSLQGLSVSIYAYAILGIRPTDKFIELWEKSAVAGFQSKRAEPINVCNSLYAFAVLGIRPSEEFLRVCEEAIDGFLEHMTMEEKHLSTTMYALGILSAVKQMDGKTGIARKMGSKIVDHIEMSGARFNFNERQKQKIFQACQWFDFESPTGPGMEEDPFHPVEERRFMAMVGQTMRDYFRTVSAEDTVIFEKLGHAVDGAYEKNDTGKRVYLELDGHYHFVRSRDENGNTRKQYNGSTLFQTALTRKLAPEAIIIRVPSNVARQIFRGSPEEQRRDVKRIFSTAVYKEQKHDRGSFVVCPNPSKSGRWTSRRMRDENGGLTHVELS